MSRRVADGDNDNDGARQGPPYRVLTSEQPFTGHVVGVRVDRIADREGREGIREVVVHPGAVAALVIDERGRVVMVEQWRQAMGRRMLEVVAGKYDVAGESPERTLRRELAEEIGFEGGTLTFLTSFATTPGWSNEIVDLYLVEGARPMRAADRPPPDWEEAGLKTVAVPFAEAVRLAAAGAVGDGGGDAKTLVALGLYGLIRAGAWSPNPSTGPAFSSGPMGG